MHGVIGILSVYHRQVHNKLENRTTGELTKLGQSLQDMTVPGKNWRAENSVSENPPLQEKKKKFVFYWWGLGVSKCAKFQKFQKRRKERQNGKGDKGQTFEKKLDG